jgi:hypothetical protein
LRSWALARGFIEVDRADGSDVQALPLGRGQSHAGGEFVGAPTERLRDHGGDEFGALGFLHPGGGADEQRAYGRASGAYLAWRANSQSRTDNLCKRCPRSRGPCNDRLPPARETTNYFKLPTWADDNHVALGQWGTQENSEEVHPKTDMTAYHKKISGVRFH